MLVELAQMYTVIWDVFLSTQTLFADKQKIQTLITILLNLKPRLTLYIQDTVQPL